MSDMAETAPCQWGVLGALMRLRKRIKDRFQFDRMISIPDDHLEDETHANPQFYDAMELPNCDGFQFQSYTAMLQEGDDGQDYNTYEQEAYLTLEDFDYDMDEPGLVHSTSGPEESVDAQMEPGLVYSTSGPEEFMDAQMELPEITANSEQLGRVDTAEMVDSGQSSLQPSEWQKIMLLRQFFDIDGDVQAGVGWKVIVGIVSAFRRLSGIIKARRVQRTASGQVIPVTPRRIGQNTRYKGIRQRNGKWVSEIRIGGTNEKVWLGSYLTEKEAALAFDAGRHHCGGQRFRSFNFADSPRLLGDPQSLHHLSSHERRTRIQRLAEDHARMYGNANIR